MDLSAYLSNLATLDEPTNVDNAGNIILPPPAPVDPTAGLKPLSSPQSILQGQSAAPASLPTAASSASDVEDDGEDEKSPGPGGKSPAPTPSAASSSATPAAPSAYDAVRDMIAKKYGIGDDKDALAAAQAKARAGVASANMGDAFGSIINGMSGGHAPVDTKFYDSLREQAQTPVKNLIQQRAFGEENLKNAKGVQDLTTETIENDPASPMNQSFRTMLQKIPAFKGINLDGVTVKTPGIEKLGASFEAAEARKVQMSAIHEARQARIQQRGDAMGYTASTALQKSLDPTSAPNASVFGKNAAIVSQAAKLNQLFAQSGFNLDNRQMHEMAVAQAVMLANGGSRPAQELIESLVPNTGAGKWNKAVEYFSNQPTGLGQQAFAKKAFDMVNRESDLAKQKIQEAQFSRVHGFENQINKYAPGQLNGILASQGVDPNAYSAYAKNGYKMPVVASAPPAAAPKAPGASSPPPAGKVKVSNGTKSFFIDPTDLAHAQADGFKQVQ